MDRKRRTIIQGGAAALFLPLPYAYVWAQAPDLVRRPVAWERVRKWTRGVIEARRDELLSFKQG